MFKKFMAIAICAVMMLAAALPVFAGSNDSAFDNVELELYMEALHSDEQAFQMRGFAVSPDGKYIYCGFLQANPGERHVSQYDASDGAWLGDFAPLAEDEDDNENNDLGAYGNDYPKGIAVDNRGYVFVGVTHANTPFTTIYCLDVNMEPVSHLTENVGGTDITGINGIATQKFGDKIYLYVLTCYNKDTIRRYDVTDVTNIHLDETFGQDGVIDYNELTGSQKDPGYLCVDVDGYIYLCYLKETAEAKRYSKGSHVMKIDKDGKNIIGEALVPECYGIATAGDYLFVSTHDDADSCVYVLDKGTLETVKVIKYEEEGHITPFSGIAFADGYLWVGDHEDATTTARAGSVLRSTSRIDITRDPRETEVVETEAPATTEPETTVPEDTTEEEVNTDPVDTTATADTENTDDTAKDSEAATTAKTADTTTGGGSKTTTKEGPNVVLIVVIIVVAVAVIAVIVVLLLKKKKK